MKAPQQELGKQPTPVQEPKDLHEQLAYRAACLQAEAANPSGKPATMGKPVPERMADLERDDGYQDVYDGGWDRNHEADNVNARRSIASLASIPVEEGQRDLYHEAQSVHLPTEVRQAYTRKIWVLLTLQMTSTLIFAVIVNFLMPTMPEGFKDTFNSVFTGFLIAMGCNLALLFLVRSFHPYNYIVLAFQVFLEAVFFGMCKWAMKDGWHLHFLAIIVFTLNISTLAFYSGFTSALARCLERKHPQYMTEDTEKEWKELIAATKQIRDEKISNLDNYPVAVRFEDIFGEGEKYSGTYIRMPGPLNGRCCWCMPYNHCLAKKRTMYLYWNNGWCVGPTFGDAHCALFVADAPQLDVPCEPYPHTWQRWDKSTKTWVDTTPRGMLGKSAQSIRETKTVKARDVSLGDLRRLRQWMAPLALLEVWTHNQSVLEATMILGLLSWILAATIDLSLTIHVLGDVSGTSTVAAGFATFLSFFFCLFFHFQVERQMRRCKTDRFMNVIVYINAEILLIFLVLCVCAMMCGGGRGGEEALAAVGDGGGEALAGGGEALAGGGEALGAAAEAPAAVV